MRRFLSLSLLLVLGLGVQAQQVDRTELEDVLNRSVNFQNYTGTYARIDSLAQIRAIGQTLAQGIVRSADSQGSYGDKYRVYHILGTPEEAGRPADILELLPNAGVDHIDNVRRIIAAYLEAAYGYSPADARTLSIFITVYNAVYRGDMAFFQSRYKASVLRVIRPEAAGIALSYRDWPGKTMLFIPLSRAISDQTTVSTVAASDLVQAPVIETIRDQTERGIEERQDLADIIDRSIDEQQDLLEAQQAAAAAQSSTATTAATTPQTPPASTATANQAATTAPANTTTNQAASTSPASATTGPAATTEAAATEAATTEAAATTATEPASTTTQAAAESPASAATPAETTAQALQQEIQEANQAAQELRDSTAEDIQSQNEAQARVSAPQLFPQARVENGMVLSRLQRVDPADGRVLQEASSLDIVGKAVIPYNGQLLVMAFINGQGRLALLNQETLVLERQGTEDLSPYGDLVVVDNQLIFAIRKDADGKFYLGRYKPDLSRDATSRLALDQASAIRVVESVLFVQRSDGRMTGLDKTSLDTAR